MDSLSERHKINLLFSLNVVLLESILKHLIKDSCYQQIKPPYEIKYYFDLNERGTS